MDDFDRNNDDGGGEYPPNQSDRESKSDKKKSAKKKKRTTIPATQPGAVASFEPPTPLYGAPAVPDTTRMSEKKSPKKSTKKKKRLSAPATEPGAVASIEPLDTTEPSSFAMTSGAAAAAASSTSRERTSKLSKSGKKKRRSTPATVPGAVSASSDDRKLSSPSNKKKKNKSSGKKKRTTVSATVPGAMAAMELPEAPREPEMEAIRPGAISMSSRASSSEGRKSRRSTGSRSSAGSKNVNQESTTSFTSFSDSRGDIEAPVLNNAPVLTSAAVEKELRYRTSEEWDVPGMILERKEPEASKNLHSKKSLYICLGIAALLIIALGVGLSVGLSKNSKKIEEDASRGVFDAPTQAPTDNVSVPTPGAFPPPTLFPTPFPTPFLTPNPTIAPTPESTEIFPACSVCGEGLKVGNPAGILESEGQTATCLQFEEYCFDGNCSPEFCATFMDPEALAFLAVCDCIPVEGPTLAPTVISTFSPTATSSAGKFEPCSICPDGVLGNDAGTVTLEGQSYKCGDMDDFCLGGSCSPDQCALFADPQVQAILVNCQCSNSGTSPSTETSAPGDDENESGIFEPCSICSQGFVPNPGEMIVVEDVDPINCGDMEQACQSGFCDADLCQAFVTFPAAVVDCGCNQL